MPSTIITTNADALSRAADAILARGDKPTKNAILNALAAAITGTGHDWGFVKNAPEGKLIQPGLAPSPEASDAPDASPATSAWVLHYDERLNWGRAPMLFATRQAALDHVAQDHNWWRHADHPFDDVMAALEDQGQYTFEPADDFQDDYDPYQIWLQELQIEGGTEIEPAPQDEMPPEPKTPVSYHLVLFDAPATYEGFGGNGDDAIFKDRESLETYVKENNVDLVDPDWQKRVRHAIDCKIVATFRPEAWVRDYAMEVDPQGETQWTVDADEFDNRQPDLDFLQQSRNAPDWVKDWGGPFEITIAISHPDFKN